MAAFYRSKFSEFVSTAASQGLDKLTAGLSAAGFNLTPDQRAAWVEEWPRLVSAISTIDGLLPASRDWEILLEYTIPGRHKRIDAVVLTPHGIIVIEFKSGKEATSAARWQVREYCWNLRDFHRESYGVPLSPILCVAEMDEAMSSSRLEFTDRHNLVLDLQTCNPSQLAITILCAFECLQTRPAWIFDGKGWDDSSIQPTPSVIEFAQKLFGGHDVREITHAHSDNTDIALKGVLNAITEARRESKRIICFVTGVPGAGKTLVGLNAAYREETVAAAGKPICFASGNKPLLKVLKKALVKNRSQNPRQKREITHDITAPVEDVHDYVRDKLSGDQNHAPSFNCLVFDEAQRVWTAEKLSKGLQTRGRRGQLSHLQIDKILSHGKSEPQLLLTLMERCTGWSVVIALVGGGQEIHDGEAGLAEWGRALASRDQEWTIWASRKAITGDIGSAGQRLFVEIPTTVNFVTREDLDLTVSKRSIRAERYADWVNNVVTGNAEEAKRLAAGLSEFPVFLTRSLKHAKQLINTHADINLRSGLLASSGAVRLRADGIEVSPEFRDGISYPDWFLRPFGDIRSSSHLEVAATEFECQGLELDWCCVCWGSDFLILPNASGWQFQRLRSPGGKAPQWYPEDAAKNEFVRNKYRVLLTRARIGVIIYVPLGCASDETLSPKLFDATADFLTRCGALVS